MVVTQQQHVFWKSSLAGPSFSSSWGFNDEADDDDDDDDDDVIML